MDLAWLEDFRALARTGHFSRAASLRHLTQPAFSRRIRALEEWVGAALFDRSAHPVALTPAGRRFEPVAEDVLRRVLIGRDEARAAGPGGAAVLRLAATHVLSFTFLPDWLRGLDPGPPQAAIHLVSDNLDSCERLMLEGRAHFLLCHRHPAAPGRLEAAGFTSLRVGEDTLCPVAAADAGRPRHCVEGTETRWLAYSEQSGLGRIIAAARPALARAMRRNPAFTAHLAAALKTMVENGQGVAWLPASLIRAELARGTLARAGDAALDIPLDIHLVRPEAEQGPVAEDFWHRAGGARQTQRPRAPLREV